MNTGKKRDQYKLSEGNLTVLRTIPLMMKDSHYRYKLREMTIEYLLSHKNK